MLKAREESLFSGLTAVSSMFAEDSFPVAHQYFCSRNNIGCFAHLLWLDSSSDPKPPQDVLNLKGAVLPFLSAADASQKSQSLAVNATATALQKNTEGRTLHVACTTAGLCPGLPTPTLSRHPCAHTALLPAAEVPAARRAHPRASSSSWMRWERAGIQNMREVDDEDTDADGNNEGADTSGRKIRWHVKVSALE